MTTFKNQALQISHV